MRLLICILLATCFTKSRSQSFTATDTVGNISATTNVYNKPMYSDSLSSSFCIVIKKEVKAHKHVSHTEQVLVLEGEGTMTLDGKTFSIKKGDLVFIPKNTVHSVKSNGKVPLKVLSVQAPRFDGSDRVWVEEK